VKTPNKLATEYIQAQTTVWHFPTQKLDKKNETGYDWSELTEYEFDLHQRSHYLCRILAEQTVELTTVGTRKYDDEHVLRCIHCF